MNSLLQNNDIEMYSRHNEGKSAIAERFIRILKNKDYKCMTSVSKNVYIDKLDDIVNKYDNTNHSAIKMKPSTKKLMIKIQNLKLVIVRISKYKNIFAKGYTPN